MSARRASRAAEAAPDLLLTLPGGLPFLAPVHDPRRGGARASAQVPLDAPDEEGVALCLSGGGWRALAFHLGALEAFAAAGWLPRLTRVSGVSCGAVVAARLVARWGDLAPHRAAGLSARLETLVLAPLRALAGRTLDLRAILGGLGREGGVSAALARALRPWVGAGTLTALPRRPLLSLHATSLADGALWVFDRDGFGPHGAPRHPGAELPLALAVAASAAFPPPLSPCRLEGAWGRVALTDGGVYDNLGLETAWPACRTVFASDGGGRLAPAPSPSGAWPAQALRVLRLVDAQVRALRGRQLAASFALPAGVPGHRRGALWSIHDVPAEADGDAAWGRDLAALPTRLRALSAARIADLASWGRARAGAALAAHPPM